MKFARFLFLLLLSTVGHAQELIPLEQYVQQYFKQKAAREALEAQMPKPKPTPIPQLPPYPNIFAPYNAPSLLKSIPKRDYEPEYVRPGLVPNPFATPAPKAKPAPKKAKPAPTPETFYVSK